MLVKTSHSLYKETKVGSYLSNGSDEEDAVEDGIGEEALKDVSLAVNLARVHLIEKRHHHKGVEDDGEVLRGQGVQWGAQAGVNVEEAVTWKRKRGKWLI